jgi:hypothetical protein
VIATTAALVAASAGVVTLVPATVLAARGARAVQCTATVDYVAGLVTSSYAQTFVLANGETFVDDRSTATREETFSATLGGDVLDVTYFKDVTTFDNVLQSVTVQLDNGHGVADGVNVFGNSSGNHRTTYALTCDKA